MGRDVAGTQGDPLHITITSNTHSWQDSDLTGNQQLAGLELDMPSVVAIPLYFLFECANLQYVNLTT